MIFYPVYDKIEPVNKLLIITGPTATGKTALAVKLAKKYDGEMISADSRQVYKGMNFGTGKDLPKNSEYFDQNQKFKNRNPSHSYGFYLFDGVPVWGLDVVNPDYSFSVSDFTEYAKNVVSDIEKRGRQPIVVGGTGLYLRGLLGQIETLGSIFDEKLRRDLEKLSVEELQKKLIEADHNAFLKMNVSDQKNPRRLTRAIEIAHSETTSKKEPPLGNRDTQVIVLSAPIDFILTKIENRPRGEIFSEVKELLGKGYDFSLPSMTGLGYKAFKPLSDKLISGVINNSDIEKSLTLWNREDRQYAKRQLTFLKKYFPETDTPWLKTSWVDITAPGWQSGIESMLSQWYT